VDRRAIMRQGGGENRIMRAYILTSFANYNCNDQVKEDGIGKLCGKYGEERNAYRILVRKPETWRVRERTIPTERPPLVGEVIANLCG
jgi:hypothetical protein